MRLTAVLAIACLVALAFAGCSGKDKDDGDKTSSTSSSSSRSTSTSSSTSRSSTSTTSSSSSSSTGPSNRPPTGSVSASVNGTAATFNLTGSDPDGDALVWDLDFGDGNTTNGTSLPSSATHTYVNFTGNVTVVFGITDGKSPVSYNVTFALGNATAAGITFAGTTTGFDPTAGGTAADPLPTPADGCFFSGTPHPAPGGRLHTIETPMDGWAWTLSASYSAWFHSADGTGLGGGDTSGTVPAGAADVAICTDDPTLAQAGSYTFTAAPA